MKKVNCMYTKFYLQKATQTKQKKVEQKYQYSKVKSSTSSINQKASGKWEETKWQEYVNQVLRTDYDCVNPNNQEAKAGC